MILVRTGGKDPADFVGREASSPDRPPPAAGEVEERGWVDYLASLEEGLDRLTSTLEDITAATTQGTQDAVRYGDLIKRARASAEPNVNARVRLIMSEYARTLDDYGQRLAAANAGYESVTQEIQDGIEFVLVHGTISDENDRVKLGELISSLQGMEEASSSARAAYSESRQTLKTFEGVERNLTRAAKVVGRELESLGLASRGTASCPVRR